MTNERIKAGFFFLIVIGVLLLNVLVFLPYVTVLFLGLVFSIVFFPVYRKVLNWTNNKKNLSALISVIIILVLILGPTLFFVSVLINEASGLYVGVLGATNNESAFSSASLQIEKVITKVIPNFSVSELNLDLHGFLTQGLSWLIDHLSVVFSKFIKIFFGLFLMLLAIFYFLRDGEKFLSSAMAVSPLDDSYDKRIIERIGNAINSVIRSYLIIAMIQGILVGFGFYLFDVPSPAIWGFVAAISSIIPTIGTSMVTIPGVLFLLFTGHPLPALGLLIWAITAVGLIDNFLAPIIIKSGVNIHPFLILMSVLGGIAVFGPLGFIIGPVLLSLLFTLFDLYPMMFGNNSSSETKKIQ